MRKKDDHNKKTSHLILKMSMNEAFTGSCFHPKVSSYQLRSGNNGIFLDYPSGKMLTTFGDRAFSVAAPKLWNALPFHIRSEQKLTSFKCNIKTHLFKAAF